MKKLYILVSILTVLNLYFIYTISNFEYHFETLKESNIRLANCEPLTSKETEIRQFKEEYYLKQQDRDTKLIFLVIPILFGLVSYLTYKKVLGEVTIHRDVLDKKYTDYETKWDEQHKRLSKLELDLYFQIGLNYSDYAEKHRIKNDFKNYIITSMCAMEKYAQVINLCESDSYKQLILNTLNSAIDFDFHLIKNISTIYEVSDLDFSVYKIRILTISNVLDSKNLQMFNVIASIIKIV